MYNVCNARLYVHSISKERPPLESFQKRPGRLLERIRYVIFTTCPGSEYSGAITMISLYQFGRCPDNRNQKVPKNRNFLAYGGRHFAKIPMMPCYPNVQTLWVSNFKHAERKLSVCGERWKWVIYIYKPMIELHIIRFFFIGSCRFYENQENG